MNGTIEARNMANNKTPRNFKLLADPCIIKGSVKTYRYDGVVPNDPTHPNVIPRDPRNPISRMRSRVEPLELNVPRYMRSYFIYLTLFYNIYYYRFKIDQNYVGEPPAIEITITNLNDNIDKTFLSEMIQKCGPFDEINIYHHPVTNKHLGIARIVFEAVKSAKFCIDRFNGTSVMGKVCVIVMLVHNYKIIYIE